MRTWAFKMQESWPPLPAVAACCCRPRSPPPQTRSAGSGDRAQLRPIGDDFTPGRRRPAAGRGFAAAALRRWPISNSRRPPPRAGRRRFGSRSAPAPASPAAVARRRTARGLAGQRAYAGHATILAPPSAGAASPSPATSARSSRPTRPSAAATAPSVGVSYSLTALHRPRRRLRRPSRTAARSPRFASPTIMRSMSAAPIRSAAASRSPAASATRSNAIACGAQGRAPSTARPSTSAPPSSSKLLGSRQPSVDLRPSQPGADPAAVEAPEASNRFVHSAERDGRHAGQLARLPSAAASPSSGCPG